MKRRRPDGRPPTAVCPSSKRQPSCALIVDGDFLKIMLVLDILRPAGFRTLMALDAAEAHMVLQRHAGDIALLITDVDLPGEMDGFGLARSASALTPSIKILCASGTRVPGHGDLPDGAMFVTTQFSTDAVHCRLQDLLFSTKGATPFTKRAVL